VGHLDLHDRLGGEVAGDVDRVAATIRETAWRESPVQPAKPDRWA